MSQDLGADESGGGGQLRRKECRGTKRCGSARNSGSESEHPTESQHKRSFARKAGRREPGPSNVKVNSGCIRGQLLRHRDVGEVPTSSAG